MSALQTGHGLTALPYRSGSLFSPVYRGGKYSWLKVMDSDGLVLCTRPVHDQEGGAPIHSVSLLLGAVFQSEDSTAQTKPNPLGKSALAHVPNGVWVDLKSGERRRLDRVVVVFVLPDGAGAQRQKAFTTASRNVKNAADLMPDAVAVTVRRGASAATIADELVREVRPFLVGRGRPRSEV